MAIKYQGINNHEPQFMVDANLGLLCKATNGVYWLMRSKEEFYTIQGFPVMFSVPLGAVFEISQRQRDILAYLRDHEDVLSAKRHLVPVRNFLVMLDQNYELMWDFVDAPWILRGESLLEHLTPHSIHIPHDRKDRIYSYMIMYTLGKYATQATVLQMEHDKLLRVCSDQYCDRWAIEENMEFDEFIKYGDTPLPQEYMERKAKVLAEKTKEDSSWDVENFLDRDESK